MNSLLRATLALFFTLLAAHAEQGVLRFDKLSKFDRSAEPVLFSLPLPKGAARNPRVRVRDFPTQASVTSRWPDGSARWLLVRTLVDLPGNRGAEFTWEAGDALAPAGARPIVAKQADGSLAIHTGPLQCTIPTRGFLPFTDIRLDGRPVVADPAWLRGFTIRTAGQQHSTADAAVTLTIVEDGPAAAVVRITGRHGAANSPFDFTAQLTFWRGKPYVAVDYRVLNARGPAATPVNLWEWSAAPRAERPATRIAYGYYNTRIVDGGAKPLTYFFGADDFRYGQVEHAFQSYWGDFWCDWRGAQAGLAVTLRQAQQNFPKGMAAAPDRLAIALYPEQKQPLDFPLGAAKSHELLFHFHAAGADASGLSARSLQFQIPDVPRLDSDWYRRCAVWDEPVFHPKRMLRFEALIYDVLDNRPVGMGIWNFGDEVDWGYTGQGRGRDEVVWLNNEYDFAHLLFLEYARTGERRFLDFARVNATHWRDVDIDWASSDPLRRGGHIAHSARHRSGGVGPSHQWVEGLLDAWHYFGDTAAREAALGIGDNILRIMEQPRYRDPANSSTRDMGWALRALMALYRETGDTRYVEPCKRILELFRRWHQQYPGMLAPYTDHTLARQDFMTALSLVSVARALRYFPDDGLKKMVLEETDSLLANGRNALGLFYYKELPSLQHQGSNAITLQLLAEAHRLSGDRRYLEAGLTQLEYLLTNLNMRLVIHTGAAEKFTPTHDGGYQRVLLYAPGGKHMGVFLMPVLEYLEAARDLDALRKLDYQTR